MADDGTIHRICKLKKDAPPPNRQFGEKIGQILAGLRKFAIDSAVGNTLKSVTGKWKVHKIVQEEGLKDQLSSSSLKDKKQEEFKTNELEEEMNHTMQQQNVLAKTRLPEDKGMEVSDLPMENPKKIFIRSRL